MADDGQAAVARPLTEEANDPTRSADWNSCSERSTTLANNFRLTKRLTQFSYFRYEISFRDGSRIVPFIAYLGRLRESAITQRGILWPTAMAACPPFPPLTDDLLLRLLFFSSRSSSSSFSVPRLGPPASLFHLSPSHSSPACLTTAADADVNSTWDGVYANLLLEIFSDLEAAPRVFMSINARQRQMAGFRCVRRF